MTGSGRDLESDLPTPDVADVAPAPAAPANRPPGLHALRHLQQTAGNRNVQRLVQAAAEGHLHRQPSTTIDFEPDVITVPTHSAPKSAEGSAVREINLLVARQVENLRSTQQSLLAGIDNFESYQSFASSGEAKADYAGVVFKYAFKTMLEEAVKGIGKEAGLPGLSQIWKITFGLVEALDKEHSRSLKAGSEVLVRDFIVQYRQLITDVLNERIGQGPAVQEGLNQDYSALGTPAEAGKPAPKKKGEPEPVPGFVVGDKAAFLNGLKTAVDGYRVPSGDMCLKTLTEAWIMNAEHDTRSRGGGDMYADGRIMLDVEMSKDGDKYKITGWPEKGRLASPRAGKTIDALTRIFASGVSKNTNDLQILKVLTIDVEDEVSGFNDHYKVYVKFRSPEGGIEEMSTIPSPVDSDTVPKARGIGDEALKLVWAEADKLGVTQLSPVSEGWKI